MAASPARVLVVVGAVAKYAFEEYLLKQSGSLSGPARLFGPTQIAGLDRLLLVVPHPSSFGGSRALSSRFSEMELSQIRQALAA